MIRRLLIVVLLFGTAACVNAPTTPDLARLYATQAAQVRPPPLILIHGVLGSRLADRDTSEEIWPGSVARLAFSGYHELRLGIDPDSLAPLQSRYQEAGITAGALGLDFYGRALATLEGIGGYEHTVAGTPAMDPANRYYVYAYDWRQDNVLAANGLDALIEQIRADHGDPTLRVDIVAHSMGGLIARYYVRYGTDDVLDDDVAPVTYAGNSKIRRIVLLGTPSLGSIASLELLVKGKTIGFGRMEPEIVATFPSAYQVLPYVRDDWLIDPSGKAIDADVFDINWWRDNRIGLFSAKARERFAERFPTAAEADAHFAVLVRFAELRLTRGRRFARALSQSAPELIDRYIVFGGSCTPTVARALLETDEGVPTVRFSAEQVVGRQLGVNYLERMYEPGDGTVTKWSLLGKRSYAHNDDGERIHYFPIDYPVFLCESHSLLTSNPMFQDNLLNALFNVD